MTQSPTPPDFTPLDLAAFGIVTRSEWESAASAGAPAADLGAVVAQLRHTSASWGPKLGCEYPALTDFQANRVLDGKAADLRLHHYILLDELGEGGSGYVFLARNLNVPRLEAVKVLRSAGGETLVPRFEREVWCLATLHDRGFTQIHYAGKDGDRIFYAMEYVHGRNLLEHVGAATAVGVAIPVPTATAWIYAAASALRHAHERGIVHRDVKPQNIMVTPAGPIKLLDWSIAKLGNLESIADGWTTITTEATPIGSVQVMPVEQWTDGRAVTCAADIYSLGCTYFFALTGRMPFEHETVNGLMMAHAYEPPPVPSDLRLEIPEQLDRVVLRMLAKSPGDRYQTAMDLMGDLEPFVPSGVVTVPSGPLVTDRSRHPFRPYRSRS